MYALVGRVEIKPGHEEETATMARDHGPALVGGLSGGKSAYWARSFGDSGELIQHSFWLFDTEDDARAADRLQLATGNARGARRLHQRRRLRGCCPDVVHRGLGQRSRVWADCGQPSRTSVIDTPADTT